jgi:hypothetical protein
MTLSKRSFASGGETFRGPNCHSDCGRRGPDFGTLRCPGLRSSSSLGSSRFLAEPERWCTERNNSRRLRFAEAQAGLVIFMAQMHLPAPAVLGSQVRQCAQQGRPLGLGQHEGRPSGDLRSIDDKYGAKYEKAVACLTKDRDAMLAFFDFPAEHWDHLRTSNPIASMFATVRHRTVRTKGASSAKTAKLMVFKLVTAAAKTRRRLKGENQLPKVVQGVRFQNGIEVIEMPAHHAA